MLKQLLLYSLLLYLFASHSVGEESATVEEFHQRFDVDQAYLKSRPDTDIDTFILDQKAFIGRMISSAVEAMPEDLLSSKSTNGIIEDAQEIIEIFLAIGKDLNDPKEYKKTIEFVFSYMIASYDFDKSMEDEALRKAAAIIEIIDEMRTAFSRVICAKGEHRIEISDVKNSHIFKGLLEPPLAQNIGQKHVYDHIGKQFAKTIFDSHAHSVKMVIRMSMSNVFMKGATVKKFLAINITDIEIMDKFLVDSAVSFFDSNDRLPLQAVSLFVGDLISSITETSE